MKENKIKQDKQLKEIKRSVLLALLICLIIYIIYSIISLISSQTETFLLSKGEISKEEVTSGYILRDEKIIENDNTTDEIEKVKGEGEKVSQGEVVYKYYTIQKDEIKKQLQELEQEIQKALEGQTQLFTSDIKALEEQIQNKLNVIKGKNDIKDIQEYKSDINTYITKKAKITGEGSPANSYIKDLIYKKYQLDAKISESATSITAPQPGIVSYRIDELEDTLSMSNVDNLTVELLDKLNLKTGQIIGSSDNTAKVVNNFNCYIAVVSTTEEAKKAEIGDKVLIRLSTGEEIKGRLELIKDSKNSKILIFKINQDIEQLINYRKVSLEIIWWQSKGLKVPNTAIMYEKGFSYIVKRELGRDEKILVKIKNKNEKYSLVDNYTMKELLELGLTEEQINDLESINLYDEIVVK